MNDRAFPWGRWVSLYAVISFGMLGLDAWMNHRSVFGESPFTYIPVVFAPLGTLVCAVCVASHRWRRESWLIGILAVLVGLLGTYFHVLPSLVATRHGMSFFQALLHSSRPIFAPAAFASTGLLMLLVAWGTRRMQVDLTVLDSPSRKTRSKVD